MLAGCQHPLAPSFAGRQPVRVNQVLVAARAVALVDNAMQWPAPAFKAEACAFKTGAPETPKPKDASPVANTQNRPDCLTGQLADSLMLVFKTFTGR
jgi:hypothetical protein